MTDAEHSLSNTSGNSYMSVLIEMEGCFDEDEETDAPAINTKDKSDFPGASVSPVDLEELEKFAKRFKDRRTALGYTQGDVGLNVGRFYGHDFSQTTVSRFEALNLSFKNMCKLKPILENWLRDAEAGRLPNPSKEGAKPVWEDDMERRLPAPLPVVSSKRRRRRRTSIGHSSLVQLEKLFGNNRKPSGVDLEIIGEKLGLEKEVVRVWFCNRRQKYKRDTKCGGAASSAFGDPDASDDDAVDGDASSGTPLSASDTARANDPGSRGAKRRKSGLLLHFDEPGGALPATVTFPMETRGHESCCRNEGATSSSKWEGDHCRVSNFVENSRSDLRRLSRAGNSTSEEGGSESSIDQRIIAKHSSSMMPPHRVFVASAGSKRGGVGIFGGRKKPTRRGNEKSRVTISKVLEGAGSRLAVPGSASISGKNCGGNGRWFNSNYQDSGPFCGQDDIARSQLLLNCHQSNCDSNNDVYANDQISDTINFPNFPSLDQLTSVSSKSSAANCLESAVHQLLNSSGENGLFSDRSCGAEISLPRHWSESKSAEMGAGVLGDVPPNNDVCGTPPAPSGLNISWDNNLVYADIPQLEELLPDALSREVLANEGFDQTDTNSAGDADRDRVLSKFAEKSENGENGGASSGLVLDANGFPIVLTLNNGSKFLLVRRGADSVFPIALESLSAIVQGRSDQHMLPRPDDAGSRVARCAQVCSNSPDCVNNNDSHDVHLSRDLTSMEAERRRASPETERRPDSNDGIPVFSGSVSDGASEIVAPPDSVAEGDHGKSAKSVDNTNGARQTVILLRRLIPDSAHNNSTSKAFLSNKMPNLEQSSSATDCDQNVAIGGSASILESSCLEHPAPCEFGVGCGLPNSLTEKSEDTSGVKSNFLTAAVSPGLNATVHQESNGNLQNISNNFVTESVLKSVSPANETKLIIQSGSISYCSDSKPSIAKDCQLNCELIPNSKSESLTATDLLLKIGSRRKRIFDIDDINSSTEEGEDGCQARLNDGKLKVINQNESDAGGDCK